MTKLTIAIALLAACSNEPTANERLLKLAAEGPYKETNPLIIRAAYAENVIAGDDAFKGKAVRVVDATIDEVSQNSNGTPIVRMHRWHQDSENAVLLCEWSTREEAARLEQNGVRNVTVLGAVRGMDIVVNIPVLVGCHLETK